MPNFKICIFQTKNCNSWLLQNCTLLVCQLKPYRIANLWVNWLFADLYATYATHSLPKQCKVFIFVQYIMPNNLKLKKKQQTREILSTVYWHQYNINRNGVYETLCPQHTLASKDNLETRCQSQKRGIIQSNIYRNLPKVNQVIYTVDTACVPNIMILAQMLLLIFCW